MTPIIYENTESLGTALMTSVGICTVSVICALASAYIDIKADEVELFIKHSQI